MNKFVRMAAAFAFSTLVLEAHAGQGSVDDCPAIYDVAATVMLSRQEGMPKDQMMQVAQGDVLMEELAVRAYQKPAHSDAEDREQAVERFADKYYRSCLELFR